MGMEIVVDNLEDMCLLMCDNIIPRSNKAKKSKKGHEDECVDTELHTEYSD